MLGVILLSQQGYNSHLFWIKILVFICLMIILCLIFTFGLRRFKFKQKDLKAAGLNHWQRRRWLARHKKKEQVVQVAFIER